MLAKLIQSFSPRRFPVMTRPSFRREMVTAVTMPLAVSLVEGGVVGVLAVKVFSVNAFQLAVITAAPMFANLTSLFWAKLSRGLPKIPFINHLMLGALSCITAIALLPASVAGSWALTALVVLTRCMLAGVITIRSTVWRHNYPRHMRGQITGRLAMLVTTSLCVAPVLGALAMDFSPSSFRVFYPLGAVIALLGVYSYSRIRLRHERSLLNYERRPTSRPQRHGEGAGLYEFDDEPRRPSIVSLLRADPLFRQYMLWQFIAGVSNMMIEPVVIAFVAARTDGLRGDFMISITLTQVLPMLLAMATLPMWAKLLDRVHIARFRVTQAWLWVGGQLVMGIAAVWSGSLITALIILALGRVVLGLARGGGMLAWNLGHNDFASREMVAAYMGVHVTLTGIRGAIAPLLGMMLYAGWAPLVIGPLMLPGFAGIGGGVFFIAAMLSSIAMVGFYALSRRVADLRAEPVAD